MEDKNYRRSLRDFFAATRLDRRNNLITNVLANRTRYITVALENIYQPHNASAVLRSCDCFGVQDIHIIENSYKYVVNPQVAVGSTQWITMHRYNELENNTRQCINALRRDGYRVVATVPGVDSVSIHDFDVSNGKFALLFGTEKEGLTPEAIAMADEKVSIPMYGFTESFNISVSVALCLFHFTQVIRNQKIEWQLTDDEALEIQLQWFRNIIPNSEILEKHFHADFYRSKD